MTVDKIYCMSSWLMHRNIIDKNKQFADNIIPKFTKRKIDGVPINNSHELGLCLEKQVETACIVSSTTCLFGTTHLKV